ncbi:MAG: YgfZ/GcvT domain-containing protein [Fimbriimonas sp.]
MSQSDLRHHAAWREMPDLVAVALGGDDRIDWLQGQITNDLRGRSDGEVLDFCVCEPTGQLLAPCRAQIQPDQILILLPKQCLSGFMDRVDQMVIIEDVWAKVQDFRVVSLQGPNASQFLPSVAAIPSDRTGFGGYDLLISGDEKLTVPESDPADWEAARLEAGIPIFGVDMGPRTLLPEMGPAFESRNISYKKGCYTGQEVLMRIHSRGHTNQTWLGVILDDEASIGANVSHAAREDAGIVTSVATSSRFGPIAAAMMRREASEGEVQVGEVRGTLTPLPIMGFVISP